jgi:type II secretory pathway pseudopilin PulG
MAHESANPKIRVMFVIAIFSALTLGLLDQVFKSYFNMMMEEEEQEKVLGVAPAQLNQLRAAEQQRLTSAALPIDRAMRELATRGREDPALKDLSKTDITPQPSNDQGPLTGWTQLGREAGAAAAPDLGAGADAGPQPTAAGDAGAPRPPPRTTPDAGTH